MIENTDYNLNKQTSVFGLQKIEHVSSQNKTL